MEEKKIKEMIFEIGDLNLPFRRIDGVEDYSETLDKMTIKELLEEMKNEAFGSGWCCGRG